MVLYAMVVVGRVERSGLSVFFRETQCQPKLQSGAEAQATSSGGLVEKTGNRPL